MSVLLVEPDLAASSLLASSLERAGHEVTTATDFEAAMTVLSRDASFDAIITALRLGAHNGLHLVLRASTDRPAMIRVVTTPKPDSVVAREASSLGATHVVAPWNEPAAVLALLNAGAQPA